jgi:hypothetical protein
LYVIFGPRKEGEIKGYVVGVNFGLALLVSFPTLFYLTTLKRFLQQTFLLDMMLVVTAVAMIAFVNLILIFDQGGTWYYRLIEIAFPTLILLYSGIIRIFLLTLQWSKW